MKNRHQTGVLSLLAAVMILIIVALVTLFASRFLVFEQATSGNQYRAAQAMEASQYGLERAIAWLQTRSASPDIDNWNPSNTTACKENTAVNANGVYSIYALQWGQATNTGGQVTRVISPTGTCNQNIPTAFTVTMGSITYDVAISYIQTLSNLGDMAFVTVQATATSQDISKGGSATVQQTLSIPGSPAGSGGRADSPILVKGCMSGVTGNPDICPANVSAGNANISGGGGAPDCATATGATGVAITTLQSQPSDPNTCLNMGNFAPHGGTRQFLNTPTITVWEALFPNGKLTEQMVQTLAAAGNPGFKYYDSTNAPNKIPALGSTTQNVLVYVDSSAGCIPLAPGNFYALIYYETTSNCDLQGGGSVDLTGSIAVEGSIAKFNANTIIRQNAFTSEAEKNATDGASIFARVPGTWRDFQ